MAEESKHDKYIICSKCKSKYINDEEHISNDFGYTRLEERYKTCVKCREKKIKPSKAYYEKHKDKIKEYREEHKDEIKEYSRNYNQLKVTCECCGKEVHKMHLARHRKTNKCKNKPIY